MREVAVIFDRVLFDRCFFELCQAIEHLLQQFVGLTYHDVQRLNRSGLAFKTLIHFVRELPENAVQCLGKLCPGNRSILPCA